MGYDLLLDFWQAFSLMEVRGLRAEKADARAIEESVRQPMFDALTQASGPLARYELELLREQASALMTYDEFWATLDHRVYFARAGFELDQTRTADDFRRLGTKSLRRRPRADKEDLHAQVERLAGVFDASRAAALVISDDGIVSGQTMSRVVAACLERGLPVRRVVVCCNNSEHREFKGVPIESIVKYTFDRAWLNERDLYWGLPRSGIPLASLPGTGIPFSIDPLRVTQRFEIDDPLDTFRTACLRINAELWRQLERAAGRALKCEDSPVLRFLPEEFNLRGQRVVDVLERLANTDWQLAVPPTV